MTYNTPFGISHDDNRFFRCHGSRPCRLSPGAFGILCCCLRINGAGAEGPFPAPLMLASCKEGSSSLLLVGAIIMLVIAFVNARGSCFRSRQNFSLALRLLRYPASSLVATFRVSISRANLHKSLPPSRERRGALAGGGIFSLRLTLLLVATLY